MNNQFLYFMELIKNSQSLLYKIFENGVYSEAGIYMLKLFQSHEWKCVIIDDFIPVVEEGGKLRPLFCSVKQMKSSDEIELWPLLLEKALASVLGCYEAVHEFGLMSYFSQLMGLPLNKVILNRKELHYK